LAEWCFTAHLKTQHEEATSLHRKGFDMVFAFQHHHAAMLLKYSGISFISGAVNHGFFSGERSLWTAAVGIALFVMGALLEHRLSDSDAESEPSGLLRTLAIGALLSIGLGFFTGGLQHFPDSPARSAWVVPLGFFVSVLALTFSSTYAWRRSTSAYLVVAGALISVGSVGAWQWLLQHPEWASSVQGHGHSHGESADAVSSSGLSAWVVSRGVVVRMDDQMRFTPNQVEVRAGETIRFTVHNDGRTAHEMVIGDEADIQAHAKAMQQGAGHADGHGDGTAAALTLAAGQSGELVVKFDQTRTLQMACLIPGHYEAGMRGTIQVQQTPVNGVAPSVQPAAPHDHRTHKH
jgi:uncharacterized cupredoxin-like copper-binding protein